MTRRICCCLGLLVAGCYNSWDVQPQSLSVLNGYRYPEPQPRYVTDTDGQPAPFETGSQLEFPTTSMDKYATIGVLGTMFTGTTYPDARPVSIDLRQVPVVHMRHFSLLKTCLAIGIPSGIVIVALAVIGAVATAQAGTTGGDGSALRR